MRRGLNQFNLHYAQSFLGQNNPAGRDYSAILFKTDFLNAALWLYSLLRLLKSNISTPVASFLSYNSYCVHAKKLKFNVVLKIITSFLFDLSFPKSIELAQLFAGRIISALEKIILSFHYFVIRNFSE